MEKWRRCRRPINLKQKGVQLLLRLMLCFFVLAATAGAFAQDSLWVCPSSPDAPLIWGRRDGIVFGLQSKGGMRGPRGLIRVGYWGNENVQDKLLNFIAVEPVIAGPGARFDRMAFSELEMSTLDPGQRGKRMWVDPGFAGDAYKGKLETIHAGPVNVERLSVRIDVERYANGAHVYVIASIDSDQPDELRLSVFAENDSAPIQELTLTATMGNYERLRLLWLNDKVVSSTLLFGDYRGDAFVEAGTYPLAQMLRDNDGDALVYATSDESDPSTTAGNATAHWPYTLPKLTQYWRVASYDVQPDLRVRVNARRVYWASEAPVWGGVAFENFETRQRYVQGQTFVFGVSPNNPWDLYKGSVTLRPYKPLLVESGAKSRP
jgi:hypothetical protein